MTKQELSFKIAAATGLNQTEAKKSLDATLAAIEDALAEGEKISFLGFGSFAVVAKAARKGRNPQTGAEIEIPARKVVKFSPGKSLKEKVNR
jgi:DNA-binding protein HU-beta